jgi:hypothetical protein
MAFPGGRRLPGCTRRARRRPHSAMWFAPGRPPARRQSGTGRTRVSGSNGIGRPYHAVECRGRGRRCVAATADRSLKPCSDRVALPCPSTFGMAPVGAASKPGTRRSDATTTPWAARHRVVGPADVQANRGGSRPLRGAATALPEAMRDTSWTRNVAAPCHRTSWLRSRRRRLRAAGFGVSVALRKRAAARAAKAREDRRPSRCAAGPVARGFGFRLGRREQRATSPRCAGASRE